VPSICIRIAVLEKNIQQFSGDHNCVVGGSVIKNSQKLFGVTVEVGSKEKFHTVKISGMFRGVLAIRRSTRAVRTSRG
jgi:hypothetical protein